MNPGRELSGGDAAPTAQGVERPGRPAAAPCHICHQPQPPCPHEGCYRHYSDGHRNIVTTKTDDGVTLTSETRCADCGAFFGSFAGPVGWDIP